MPDSGSGPVRSSASRTADGDSSLGHRTARQRFEELRELIDEPMSQRAERRGVHRERRLPSGIDIDAPLSRALVTG